MVYISVGHGLEAIACLLAMGIKHVKCLRCETMRVVFLAHTLRHAMSSDSNLMVGV